MKFFYDWARDWRTYLGEFLGAFFLIFIATSLNVVNSISGELSNLEVAICVGFVYIALVFVTAHVSGGFLNPALTASLWLVQRISSTKAITFVIAQIVAGVFAVLLVSFVFGDAMAKASFGLPVLGIGIDVKTAFLLEMILTAGMVLVVFGTFVDRNGPISFGPVALGLYLSGAIILSTHISGGIMNPAGVVGSAVLSRSWDNLGIYVIGPFVGSLFAAVYEFAFLRKPRKK